MSKSTSKTTKIAPAPSSTSLIAAAAAAGVTIDQTVTIGNIVTMYVADWETKLNGRLKELTAKLKTINDEIKTTSARMGKRAEEIVKGRWTNLGNDYVKITQGSWTCSVRKDDKKGWVVSYSLYLTIKAGDSGEDRTHISNSCVLEELADDTKTLEGLEKDQQELVPQIAAVRGELSQLTTKERQVQAALTKQTLTGAGLSLDEITPEAITKMLEG